MKVMRPGQYAEITSAVIISDDYERGSENVQDLPGVSIRKVILAQDVETDLPFINGGELNASSFKTAAVRMMSGNTQKDSHMAFNNLTWFMPASQWTLTEKDEDINWEDTRLSDQ